MEACPVENGSLVRSAIFLFLATAGLASAQPAPQPEALTALNNAFRQAYAGAKQRMLASVGPLIVVNGDTAALVRNGKRTEATVNAPRYHTVKTIAHLPLAIFVALTPGEGELDGERRKTLAEIRTLIPPARASLDALALPATVVARQAQIVKASLAYLDDVLEHGRYTRAGLQSYTRKMSPLLLANVEDATRAELDVLHTAVSRWRKEMTPAEWGALEVVVIGPHMPREDGVVMQYFSRLLGESREGRRVVYAEALWEEPRALDLLGTHLLDGAAGEAFFGDYWRMHRDLLGDAARDYVGQLLRQ
jgi:hypothetical protein